MTHTVQPDEPSGVPDLSEPHTWRLSIELKALTLSTQAAMAFARYHLPPPLASLFNPSLCVFTTHPAVMCRRNTNTHLPNAFRAYTLPALSVDRLREGMLQGAVICIEICHKDKFRSDEVIATTSIHLEEVLDAPLSDEGGCRCLSMDLPLLASPSNQSVTGPARQCGRIQALLYLEDLGGDKAPRVAPYTTAMDNITDLSMIEPSDISRHQQHSTLSTDSTGNLRPEYICAVELETWKKNEEAKFRVWLREQEAARMKTLNAEYTAKEVTRQREFAEKMKSLAALETRLKKKATELEQREIRILAAEDSIAKEKEGELYEPLPHQSVLLSVNDAADGFTMQDVPVCWGEEYFYNISVAQKRLVTDHEHALRLQAEKTKIANRRVSEAEERIKELQQKVKDAEESANKAHSTLRSSNMVQLQADVKVLKHQLEQAAHRELLLAKSRDHFRAAVRQFCNQLDKQNVEVEEESGSESESNSESSSPGDESERIRRLEAQKQSLLDTGVYAAKDATIQALNEQIARARDWRT
ncbi:hypothetical protein FOZ63_028753 [Perkinsus olseni]|uniref:Uncharacterized protein n=1 Tax=Perkinsus olseni TaxID=32597 RepID=A0A7J6PZE8_PEROL|nr:hypothetical protein FOZ63_028753 [Perkinsus olseni]